MENEEEKESQILGDERTFYTKDDGNIFGIAFDKIFKQEPLTVFDDFELNSKRNFKISYSTLMRPPKSPPGHLFVAT